jgi:K+ transporter
MKKNWKETLVALVFIGSVFMFLSLDIKASPYVEYKNEYEMKEWSHTKTTNHLRLGYKAKNNFYFEIGPMTDGHSYEAGYKFKFDGVTVKGKLETKDTGSAKTKIETEVRYTF